MLLKNQPKPSKSNYFSADTQHLLMHCISSKRETWTSVKSYATVFTGINFLWLTQVW